MAFQPHPEQIHWKVHFGSPIQKVFDALTTDQGRSSFWAESTQEKDGIIAFQFIDYPETDVPILAKKSPSRFEVDYFGTTVTFQLLATEDGGTDLQLKAIVKDKALRFEMIPGWVSVLMAMKAYVDFGVDLRNHHQDRTWNNGFLDKVDKIVEVSKRCDGCSCQPSHPDVLIGLRFA